MTAVRTALTLILTGGVLLMGGSPASARLVIPRVARQLVVVSSATDDPPGPQAIATLRVYSRDGQGEHWRQVLGAWPVETGGGHLIGASRRREGDRATPTGVFSFGRTIYGNQPNPGGLHYRYHRLVCGDWWDEDPYSPRYNRFVHVPCDVTPAFASWSEALWTDTVAYPYFAVINFNTAPVHAGAGAPGSGIFLHSWIGTATQGCVALPEDRLLRLLRWLRPSQHPVIEIGTDAQIR